MSNLVNSVIYEQLISEAMDYIDSGDLSSTPLEQTLVNDISRDDMEALENHLVEAREILRDE